MTNFQHYQKELQYEKSLRKIPFLIPLITFATSILLFLGIVFCYQQYIIESHTIFPLINSDFSRGAWWWTVIAGMLGHAIFIVLIHDGSHKAITRSKMDRFFMNLGSALMLLPVYAEPFRKYHLIHHGSTNTEVDPLWPDTKRNLYNNHRWFYVCCELIPLLFTLYLVVLSEKSKTTEKSENASASPANSASASPAKKKNEPKLSMVNMIWATCVSVVWYWFLQPDLGFLLWTLLFMNAFSALRHWCEHLGYTHDLSSNTFWFPMGMGIGNHETHHHVPNISWFSLMLGLFSRKKTTSVLGTIWGVVFSKKFHHFSETDHPLVDPLD